MSESHVKITLQPFDGSIATWDTWAFKLQACICAVGLPWPLPKFTDAKDDEKLIMTKAYGVLINCLSGDALAVAMGAEKNLTSVVNGLLTKFNSQSFSMRMLALRNPVLDPKGSDSSLSNFIMQKEQLWKERLEAKVVGEELLCVSIIHNLLAEFHAVMWPILQVPVCATSHRFPKGPQSKV